MQIAINVDDTTIADKILDYLKGFKQNITIETLNNKEVSDTYLNSQQYVKDKISLETTLENITSQKTTLSKIDNKFWDDMDKVIESA